MIQEPEQHLPRWVEKTIGDYARSPENTLGQGSDRRAWSDPLVGFARGNNPLFDVFKAQVGSFFWTPGEIFARSFPGEAFGADRLTVISWVLPQTEQTREENRRQNRYPSESWARSRNFGEDFNLKLARHLVAKIGERGYRAVAPVQSPLWKWQVSDRYGLASNWSERHAAFVSGLGTFGLCDGLITAAGKAMRCGSVIANMGLAPTKRPYRGHREYCLYDSSGTCGKCISRCPAGALSKNGHDKNRCREYLFDQISKYCESRFGFASYGCGLCQTDVPCESGIPLPPGGRVDEPGPVDSPR